MSQPSPSKAPNPNTNTTPNSRKVSSSSSSNVPASVSAALNGTPPSRRQSTAKLAASPLLIRSDSFTSRRQDGNTTTTSTTAGANNNSNNNFNNNSNNTTNSGGNNNSNANINAKAKMSVIQSMLHQSPSSNSVFSMSSSPNFNSSSSYNPHNSNITNINNNPINQLNNNNTHIMLNRGGSHSSTASLQFQNFNNFTNFDNLDIPIFAIDNNDYDLINEVHKHLVAEDASLHLPGGDIARDLYKFTNNTGTLPPPPVSAQGTGAIADSASPTASSRNSVISASIGNGGSSNANGNATNGSNSNGGGSGTGPVTPTPRIRRSSSFSLAERRGSSASGINVPGGFRREYFVKKKKDEFLKNGPVLGVNSSSSSGSGPENDKVGCSNNANSNGNSNGQYDSPVYDGMVDLPPFITRNFIEFLSIYGHFAGESLEDEDYQTCTLSNSKILDEESSPLLGERPTQYGTASASQPSNIAASRKPEATATPLKAFFLLLKSFVGTGILFLPKAFFNGGLLFSAITLIFFAIYSFWCYYILIKTKDAVQVSSFGDMGQRLFGRNMKFLIIFSIILSQIGFVGAYLVFTSTNLQAFLVNMFHWHVEIKSLILLQCLIFIPLSLIRNITKLSLSSLVANLFIFVGLMVIIYYTVADFLANGPANDIVQFNGNTWSLFIGVAIFAFEGIGLIIPIQESMIEPQKFPKVLFAVIATVSSLMLLVGILCYSTYGSKTNTVIILNLPQTSIFVNSVQLFYSIAILLSAPLQLFPVIKIVENKIFGKNYSGKISTSVKWAKNAVRALLVVTCCTIAYLGSTNLDRFVSFIGCFACIPLVYMYPPMLHYRAVSKTKWARGFDVFLVIFGGIAMVYVLFQLI